MNAKELELTLTVRNNLLKSKRLVLGLSCNEIAEKIGIGYVTYLKYEAMTLTPVRVAVNRWGRPLGSKWKPSAEKIAKFHGVEVAELWPNTVLSVKQPTVTAFMDTEELGAFAAFEAQKPVQLLPEEVIAGQEIAQVTKEMLEALTPREFEVITARFGLDGNEPLTLEEVGKPLGLSRERIRGIEAAALRKLRAPVFTRQIVEAVVGKVPNATYEHSWIDETARALVGCTNGR
jgi:RNA polymerase sigma factor (sigma-70 family)